MLVDRLNLDILSWSEEMPCEPDVRAEKVIFGNAVFLIHLLEVCDFGGNYYDDADRHGC